jgi:hypothetical protein
MKYKLRKIDAIIIVILMIIAGSILFKVGYIPSPPKEEAPAINFEQDEKNHKLIVTYVSTVIKWSDIRIEGQCNISGLTTYVVEGDELTECSGQITLIYKPTDMVYGTWTFIKRDDLPPTLPISPSHPTTGTTPEDEGAHYNKIGVNREWWYYSVVFDKGSELPGWTVSVSFNHMARNDLLLSKPDMLVITLHGPDEKDVYGGILNRQRGGGIIWDPTLQVKSSDKEIILEFEDSYVQGMYPEWKVHIVDNGADETHDIVMDLDFIASSQAIWTYHSRLLNEGKSNIASYMFTGCEVAGTITIDGEDYRVKGIGRHEHSWSTSLLKPLIKGWDWCHITLENGWNIYYSNYYLTSQILSSRTHKINPLSTVLITTDKGNTLTLLENIDITIADSEKVSLLLKRPTDINIYAEPGLTQPLLGTYDIVLDLNIKFEKSIGKEFLGLLDIVDMNIGRSTVTGRITWSDEEGDHDIDLNGIGSMWTMRH